MDCTYCGSDVTAHDPVYVYDGDEAAGERPPDSRFCNYGCLQAHVEEAELATGASCNWSPET